MATVTQLVDRFDDAVTALERIAEHLLTIVNAVDDVTDRGRVHVDGLLITREDRP